MKFLFGIALIAIIVFVIAFVFDLFCRFLIKMTIAKKLPKKLAAFTDEKLQKSYKSTKPFSGVGAYIAGFILGGVIFSYSVARIFKIQFKFHEDEMKKRGLPL